MPAVIYLPVYFHECVLAMNQKELHLRFRWIVPHLQQCGQRLRELRKSRSYEVHNKRDGSRVTDADREMSRYWMDQISRTFPGETIVSEESAASHDYPANAPLVWYIDPIDGTSKFIEGLDNYFILISLCVEGVSSLGLLYQPEKETLLYATPHIRTRFYTSPDHYREIHRTTRWKDRKPLIVKGAKPPLRKWLEANTNLPVHRTANAVHNIIGALNGSSTGFISFRRTAYWDLAAPAAIMASAGFQSGLVSGGKPARYNDGDIACERFYCLPPDTPEDVMDFILADQSTGHTGGKEK